MHPPLLGEARCRRVVAVVVRPEDRGAHHETPDAAAFVSPSTYRDDRGAARHQHRRGSAAGSFAVSFLFYLFSLLLCNRPTKGVWSDVIARV